MIEIKKAPNPLIGSHFITFLVFVTMGVQLGENRQKNNTNIRNICVKYTNKTTNMHVLEFISFWLQCQL